MKTKRNTMKSQEHNVQLLGSLNQAFKKTTQRRWRKSRMGGKGVYEYLEY